MSRHSAGWTLRRRLQDRNVGRIHTGKHLAAKALTTGLQPTTYGGMEDRAGFAALAKRVAA